MNKIGIQSIRLERAEGRVEECVTVTVSTMEQAEATLRRWATTAPVSGGYHKCDFKITFVDGETYDGRFDLSRNGDQDAPTLRAHVINHCRFYGGAYRDGLPGHLDHLTLEEYRAIIGRLTTEDQAAYAAFLETYDIENAQ